MSMNQSKAFRIVCACFVVVFLFASIFPFLWILITSFKPEVEIHGNGAYNIIANNPTLENYITVIFDKHILTAVKNSFITAATTTIYVVIVASMSAFIIARFRFKGKSLLMGLILSISMFPQMIVIGPIFNMFYDLGWLNTYNISLAYCTITLPSAVWIMVTHFKQVPLSLEEAAKIDGCNSLKTLWYVIVPMLKPSLVSCALFQFMWTNNDFQGPLIYIADMEKYTNSVYLRMSMDGDVGFQWNRILAMSLISIIPSLIVFFCAQDAFIDGIAAGGVKG